MRALLALLLLTATAETGDKDELVAGLRQNSRLVPADLDAIIAAIG